MKFGFFVSLFLLPILSQAQKDIAPETRSLFTLDLGFSGAQLGAELKTAKTQTIQLRAGLMPILYQYVDLGPYTPSYTKLGWSPTVSAEYRFYYNYQRRMERNKDIRNNGVNYASYLFLYSLMPLNVKENRITNTPVLMTGPMWGFNRPLGDKILFNLTLGPVYEKEMNTQSDQITVYFDLRWSFIFN